MRPSLLILGIVRHAQPRSILTSSPTLTSFRVVSNPSPTSHQLLHKSHAPCSNQHFHSSSSFSQERHLSTSSPIHSTAQSSEASTATTSTGPTCPSQIARPRLPPLPYIYLRDLPYNRGSDLQQFLVDRQIRLRKEREERQRAIGADQTQEADLSEEGSHDLLLFVEHTPTYTNGRRNRGAQAISDKEADRLKKLGATYVESLRGGEITYHGPGQLVAYPILDLKPIKLSVRCYVSYLEKAIIATCAEWGVKAITTENTGVWLNDQQKIAAIGVHVQRYITSHGLALNCNTDLEYFNQIVACGLSGKETTSLAKELGDPSINVAKVIPTFVSGFGKVFERSLVPLVDTDKTLDQAVQDYCQTGDFAKLKEL
ncbi:putative lipoyltransferase 2, mitochondrial [Podila horticola]|nr:putative lipoyltransferase 2, mitochondrial [Podila horticola]